MEVDHGVGAGDGRMTDPDLRMAGVLSRIEGIATQVHADLDRGVLVFCARCNRRLTDEFAVGEVENLGGDRMMLVTCVPCKLVLEEGLE